MTGTPDDHAVTDEAVPLTVLLTDEDGNAVPGRGAMLDPEGIKPGHILTLGKGQNKRHWRILEVDMDEAGDNEAATLRVRVAPASSSLRWTLLLLALLGVAWFVLDYFFGFIFG